MNNKTEKTQKRKSFFLKWRNLTRTWQTGYRRLKIIFNMWARLYWGETPQTPLSVFDVGFAHVGGDPPSPPKLYGS